MINIESTAKRKADVLEENNENSTSDEEQLPVSLQRSPKKKKRTQGSTNKRKKIS